MDSMAAFDDKPVTYFDLKECRLRRFCETCRASEEYVESVITLDRSNILEVRHLWNCGPCKVRNRGHSRIEWIERIDRRWDLPGKSFFDPGPPRPPR